MTKTEMKRIINDCILTKNLCRVYFQYNKNYRYYYPLVSNEKLFLAAEEDDFIIDGYSIRRYMDIKEVQIKNDLCSKILKDEGIVDSIQLPEIDITDWETIFISLKKNHKNIIIEKESINDDDCEFYIGTIDKTYKNFIYFYHFDADGVWVDEPLKILYSNITSVSFGTRYIEAFLKYVSR